MLKKSLKKLISESLKSSNFKNDIVKAKNAEITNYGIMRIFNEVASNKQ